MLIELKNKINRLISLYEKAIIERDAAIQEKKAYLTIIEEKDKKIKELLKKNEKLQLANAFSASTTDKQEAKQKIVKIVREIDRCIVALGKIY